MQFKIFMIAAVLGSCSWCGCTDDPPPTLTYKDREMVDSLFRLQADTLRPLYDSLCTARRDSLIKSKSDSLMEERLGEIEKYLDRIKSEENQQQ